MSTKIPNPSRRFALGPGLWVLAFGSILLWSAWQPKDRFTWWLEVTPALIVAIVLGVTRRRLHLTPLLYGLILVHCAVLFVGGKYTYAEMPAFDWLRDILHQSRNNFDKVGHFMQGLVPALASRELLLRLGVLTKPKWAAFLSVSIALAISALYELVEWGAAVATGDAADAFLGTQGYVWDTQSDMGMALVGAIAAMLVFSRWQDRQILSLSKN